MKMLPIALLLLISNGALAMQMNPDLTPAIHGMLLFGNGNTLYLSHLPMFMAPHDFQVILKVQLDKQSLFEADRERTGEDFYTLVPRPFALPQLLHGSRMGLRVLDAEVYRGSFENGGVRILTNVRVLIQSIVYFQHFIPGTPQPPEDTFLYFGNSDGSFMAHMITSAPDFDEVMQVQSSYPPPLTGVVPVRLGDVPAQTPLAEGQTVMAGDAKFEVLSQIYLEKGDLQ